MNSAHVRSDSSGSLNQILLEPRQSIESDRITLASSEIPPYVSPLKKPSFVSRMLDTNKSSMKNLGEKVGIRHHDPDAKAKEVFDKRNDRHIMDSAILTGLKALSREIESLSPKTRHTKVEVLTQRLVNVADQLDGFTKRDNDKDSKLIPLNALDVLTQGVDAMGKIKQHDAAKEILDKVQEKSTGKFGAVVDHDNSDFNRNYEPAPNCWPVRAQKKTVQLLTLGALAAAPKSPEQYAVPLINNVGRLYASKGDRRSDVQGALLRGLEKTISHYPFEGKKQIRNAVLTHHKEFSTSPAAGHSRRMRTAFNPVALVSGGMGGAVGVMAAAASATILWPIAATLAAVGIVCVSFNGYQKLRNLFRDSIQDRMLTRVVLKAVEEEKNADKMKEFRDSLKAAVDNGDLDAKYTKEVNEFIAAVDQDLENLNKPGS